MRTISQAIQQYLAAISEVNGDLDLSQGSFAYTLARASAALTVEGDR